MTVWSAIHSSARGYNDEVLTGTVERFSSVERKNALTLLETAE